MDIGGIIVAVEKHLAVGSYKFRMLLSKFAVQIGVDIVQRAAVDKTGHTQSEHILALVYSLEIQAAVLEAFLSEL